MAELSDVDLDLLERTCAAASAGEWFSDGQGVVRVVGGGVVGQLGVTDGQFVAAAHALVPGLVAELRAARRALASPDGLVRSAEVEGEYRYHLVRRWDEGPVLTFCMLNPSVADDQVDDPTLRRCIGFAKSHGYAGLEVVNLFALRSTDPRALRSHRDPVGPRNDEQLRSVASGTVVAAWGSHGFARERAAVVHELLVEAGARVLCLGRSRDGSPRHPLFMPADARLVPWAPPGAE